MKECGLLEARASPIGRGPGWRICGTRLRRAPGAEVRTDLWWVAKAWAFWSTTQLSAPLVRAGLTQFSVQGTRLEAMCHSDSPSFVSRPRPEHSRPNAASKHLKDAPGQIGDFGPKPFGGLAPGVPPGQLNVRCYCFCGCCFFFWLGSLSILLRMLMTVTMMRLMMVLEKVAAIIIHCFCL